MCEKDLKEGAYYIAEGQTYLILGDDANMRLVPSIGYPLKILKVQMQNEHYVMAAVFSYRTGGRYTIVVNRGDLVSM